MELVGLELERGAEAPVAAAALVEPATTNATGIVESAAAAEASDAEAATVEVIPWRGRRGEIARSSPSTLLLRLLLFFCFSDLLLLLSGSDPISPGRNRGSIAPATTHQDPAPAIISCLW